MPHPNQNIVQRFKISTQFTPAILYTVFVQSRRLRTSRLRGLCREHGIRSAVHRKAIITMSISPLVGRSAFIMPSTKLWSLNGVNRWLNGPKRVFSSSAEPKQVKTGIVMLNMGGPAHPSETKSFLKRLFADQDIIDLGGGKLQELVSSLVAARRTPKVMKQYEMINGSPIGIWTAFQGAEMAKILDKISPESAPHKAYTAFRYINPLTHEALEMMNKDGVEHAIAFSQYPQWSCTTSGSSMNQLWREVDRLGMRDTFKWSIIDRWNLHPGWIRAVNERIEEKFLEIPESKRNEVVIVFSAHSVPMKVVEKGDHYTPEVSSSVQAIMKQFEIDYVKPGRIPGLSTTSSHILSWQSKVGYLPWMVPNTANVLKSLGDAGHKTVVVVPVAFTSDHIETLFEIGIEYAEDAKKAGISNFSYIRGLNESATFISAMADIVKDHLNRKENYSSQYKMKCLSCEKPLCRSLVNPAFG